MSRPLNLVQKKFIEDQVKQGKTSKQIAQIMGISIWTVRKWRQRLQKGGPFTQLWAVQIQVL